MFSSRVFEAQFDTQLDMQLDKRTRRTSPLEHDSRESVRESRVKWVSALNSGLARPAAACCLPVSPPLKKRSPETAISVHKNGCEGSIAGEKSSWARWVWVGERRVESRVLAVFCFGVDRRALMLRSGE